MKGLSERQVGSHLKLYSGYVSNLNALLQKIEDARNVAEPDVYSMAELRRRIGFEWNGMRLHEYYFEALGGDGTPRGATLDALASAFGSYENWENDFKQAGMARGIGWVLLIRDKKMGNLLNVWVGDHEIGNLAGCDILLAMDVWEHAFLLDYLPSERKAYIEAYFQNLNWDKISDRL